MIMNVNMNDIAGFDAMAEEIRQVYAERDLLRDENEALKEERDQRMNSRSEFARDILDSIHCTYYNPGNIWMLEQLAKDQVKRLYDGRKKQEEFTEEAASILGVHPGDLSLSDILEALRKLKRYEELNNMNCEIIADLKEERDKETDRRTEAEEYAQTASNNLEKICAALGIERSPDVTLEYILDTIDDLRGKNNTWSHSHSFGFCCICEYLGIEADGATLSDIRKEIEKLKGWKTVAADHDKRRKNWVRKYKSEHERANSCDELYKKYKALYDADAPARKKLSDDLETYRSSYEAVKNQATKNRSLMNTVAQIVGTVGMHDDVTLTGVLNAKKKANHWDVLVDGYGEGTIRSLLDNIGIDVSGDKGNGLFG